MWTGGRETDRKERSALGSGVRKEGDGREPTDFVIVGLGEELFEFGLVVAEDLGVLLVLGEEHVLRLRHGAPCGR